MSTSVIIVVMMVVVAIVVLVIISQNSGPRVTQITRHRDKEERKDGDDA